MGYGRNILALAIAASLPCMGWLALQQGVTYAVDLPESFFLGGETSVVGSRADAFSLPARNSTRAHRHSFVVGKSLFRENWVATPASVKSRQGLGPVFNAQSCSTCHFNDGRGQPPSAPGEPFASILMRLSVPGEGPHGEPVPVPNYGDQFNHRAIVGVKPEGVVKMRFEETKGEYPDGTEYSLLKPVYSFADLAYGPLPENTLFSARVAPQVIGLGLLEAIREKEILGQADPDDKNGDGISGRPNYVWDLARKKRALGRFGWKANQPTVAQQNASAFQGDMGITSTLLPHQNCGEKAEDCRRAPAMKGFEISKKDLAHVNTYVHLLAVPVRRNTGDPKVQKGEKVFSKVNCQACHTLSYQTGVVPGFPELSRQKIFPFTDLLLHDMGEGLADGRPDFGANGNEWRTPPLWGIGLFHSVNGHTRYLHDGRARNLEEAILWHGGEARKSRDAFLHLEKTDREALLRFLESL